MEYKKTLNMPKSGFPMRAGLPAREPEMLKHWEELDLYNELLKKNEGKPLFSLHDGPPFSNGALHMGHALNKSLKDFITRMYAMRGYYTPYIPGWDNHGMPIESAIIKQNKLNHKAMSVSEFRSACHEFADHYIDVQRDGFKRMGVVGDWEHPYKTMDPGFEAQEVRVFGRMYQNGHIYKGLKPVYWCPHDETALAEAEIEYKDDPCTTVYVKFPMHDDQGKLGHLDHSKLYFVIWTTTVWTLPGNLAIALHPDESYAVVKAPNGEMYIMAEALVEKVMKIGGFDSYEIVETHPGSFFENMLADHPFLPKTSRLVLADYVTMDSGTGCVHTAPGFGADDYVTCKRYGMDMVVPVDDQGKHTAYAGKYEGMTTDASNPVILQDMKDNGTLFASEDIVHSYPHCWRCKQPIIFRATPQWFCSVDSFKDEAIAACEDVRWVPAWGKDRMRSMILERTDWCISRQRRWGLPIPVFYCEACGKPVCTTETINRVSELFAQHGSNCWFEMEASELLPEGFACPHCGGHGFTKETNTLDGWFDSGSTHFAVLEDHTEDGMVWPADMYLEGGDQFRGWFQSSLLTAVGAKGQGAPYREVLTHGWVVDGEGRTMHKSLGNGVDPDDMVRKYGADIVRLWAASSDYHADVRCSDAIFRQLSETYRKIRNTARILLANLGDFNPDTDAVPAERLHEIDKWILSRLNDLIRVCRAGYDGYEFHTVTHAVSNFCTNELSKLYVDITKDRLYTEGKTSEERRCAQTAMYTVVSALTRLIAPILAFTAEEIWKNMPHRAGEKTESVFLNPMPEADGAYACPELTAHWDRLFALRDGVMKALELARANKMIGKSLDAKVTVFTPDEAQAALLESFADTLNLIFITSQASVVRGEAPEGAYTDPDTGVSVLVEPADGRKCDRCWTVVKEGKATEEDGFLCIRCLENIQ